MVNYSALYGSLDRRHIGLLTFPIDGLGAIPDLNLKGTQPLQLARCNAQDNTSYVSFQDTVLPAYRTS